MSLGVKVPDVPRQVAQQQKSFRSDLNRAKVIATDRAAKDAREALATTIRSVGLGRLSNAVGFTSSKRQGRGSSSDDAYGVVYARGGDDSLAGGALESYTRGATIRANNRQWLAYPTGAIPQRVGRRRTTPILYSLSKSYGSIGSLIFKPIKPDLALLVIKKVTLSPKNGRARKAGKNPSKTRVNADEVVAFVLIRITRRAARFDKDATVFMIAKRVPQYLQEALDQLGVS